MKTLMFTFLLFCFSLVYAHANTNPWEINKLSKNQIIELKGINYEADQSALTPNSKEAIEELKNFLLENKTVIIELQGHTNSFPPDLYCDKLSQLRADSIREYLIEQGVNPKNLVAKGYGKKSPISLNNTKTGRKSNQRVDVKVLSL